VLPEEEIDSALRARLAALLAGILDEGPRYAAEGWRTLRPRFRAIALDAGGAPAGQASGFAVATEPDIALFGLGDVAVHPRHRRRGIARRLCAAATAQARRAGAGAMLAKTKPLRGVLAELGYEPVTRFAYYSLDDGACVRHPDWMAVVWRSHPTPVRLGEGDF
jgi:GNAT superfamily N-acetyltransferase